MSEAESQFNRCAVCTKTIAPSKLLCIKHWQLMPARNQVEVLRTWRAFSHCNATTQRLHLGREYQRARDAGIAAVQKLLPGTGEKTNVEGVSNV